MSKLFVVKWRIYASIVDPVMALTGAISPGIILYMRPADERC